MNQSSSQSKLPLITLSFWIMKICATTLGETAGDLFSKTMQFGYAASSLVLIGVFFVSLFFQLRTKSYQPVIYWLVILMTSTAGTTISDYMDRTLKMGYAGGTAVLVTCLVATLGFWKWRAKTLSVDNIQSGRIETYYWTAILFSNTLGTALGDFLADNSGLGFAGGAALIGGLLAVITLAYYFTKISRVALFWLAFILTRPFGATMGDVLTRNPDEGGVGLGTMKSSLVLLGMLVALIIWTLVKQSKQLKTPHLKGAMSK